MNFKVIVSFIFLVVLLSPVHSPAGMEEALSEAELSRVTAGAGVDVEIKGSAARITAGSFYVRDTADHNPATPGTQFNKIEFNKIEFNDIAIDDGAGGGGFSFDTSIAIDAGAGASGGTIIRISGGESEPLWCRAGSLVFCDHDIGSLYMDRVTQKDTVLNIGAHGGVDFDYAGRIDIGEFRYAYNTTPDSLTASGIHLAKSAAGAPDSPSDWGFTGPFKVGDISNNPAAIDIGTDANTSMFLGLPMQGCLRVEDVNFGGTDFGPCAIDGIAVHRLQVQMTP